MRPQGAGSRCHGWTHTQEAFSADLAQARSAVEAADRRAAAAEKRALLEIEQERQARIKAGKQVESLRGQAAEADTRARQIALEQAEGIAKLQAKLDAAVAAEGALRQANEALALDARDLRDRLAASQQDVTRYRTEAQTVQALVERLAAPRARPKRTAA